MITTASISHRLPSNSNSTLGAILFAWRFGDLDGKSVLICSFALGLLSALFFAAEEIAAAIDLKIESASEFFGDLISDM